MGKKKKKKAGRQHTIPDQLFSRVVRMKNKPRRKSDFKDRRFIDDGLFFYLAIRV